MKKQKKIGLDVDVIGSQEPLTDEEKFAISNFIKQRKLVLAEHNLNSKKTDTMRQVPV